MTAKYQAKDIAEYFIWKSHTSEQELLSNMKLQKLLYYAQGLYLAIGNGALFDDVIRAWNYGPVVPEIYHKYKINGKSGIAIKEGYTPEAIDPVTQEFLDEVYDVFGQFSAIRLMEISHQDECWKTAFPDGEITPESMEKCLKKYLIDGKN